MFRNVFFLDIGIIPATIMMFVCSIALICLKSVRNIIAPPVAVATDCKEVSFAFPTRFKSHVSIFTDNFSV